MDAGHLGRFVVALTLPLVGTFGCIGPTDVTLPQGQQTPLGGVEISVSTTGTNLDPDGYSVRINEGLSQFVAINASVTFSGMTPGPYDITLSDNSPNCLVEGSNPRALTVVSGMIVNVAFTLTCS